MGRPPKKTSSCKMCGIAFEAKVSNALYCSSCRGRRRISDIRMNNFLLKQLGLTRKEAEEMFLQSNLNGDDND